MKEIGGYFEIEYSNITLGIHSAAVKLVNGRQCLEYILRSKNYDKVYLPYYLCEVVTDQLISNNVSFEFYSIDSNLEIPSLPHLEASHAILYINYFGIKNSYVHKLAAEIPNLIVDNSQALFAMPHANTDTFYSLRKFAGVADGGFLYCDGTPDRVPGESDSSDRVAHLYIRQNQSAKEGYADFQKGESKFIGMKMGKMPHSTEAFVKTYDFEKSKAVRERNFLFLHGQLAKANLLEIDIRDLCGPLCYPFLCNDGALKQKLITNSIFVATYWPNIQDSEASKYEHYLSKNILALPIDHRYGLNDMQVIADLINT